MFMFPSFPPKPTEHFLRSETGQGEVSIYFCCDLRPRFGLLSQEINRGQLDSLIKIMTTEKGENTSKSLNGVIPHICCLAILLR